MMAPVASVIRTLMAVPWGKLTVQVYELPLTFSAMVESAGAEVWPWGIAAKMKGAVPPCHEKAAGWHCWIEGGVEMENSCATTAPARMSAVKA